MSPLPTCGGLVLAVLLASIQTAVAQQKDVPHRRTTGDVTEAPKTRHERGAQLRITSGGVACPVPARVPANEASARPLFIRRLAWTVCFQLSGAQFRLTPVDKDAACPGGLPW